MAMTIEGELQLIAQGLSAYEVALANGYSGTQAEWLASLKADAIAETLDASKAAASSASAAKTSATDAAASAAQADADAQKIADKQILMTCDSITFKLNTDDFGLDAVIATS